MESSSREESDTKEFSIYSTPCIFLGFDMKQEIEEDCTSHYKMEYIGGNRCGLTSESCPIQQERRGWSECPLKNKEELIRNLGEVEVRLKELLPKGVRHWDGISLREWEDIWRGREKDEI